MNECPRYRRVRKEGRKEFASASVRTPGGKIFKFMAGLRAPWSRRVTAFFLFYVRNRNEILGDQTQCSLYTSLDLNYKLSPYSEPERTADSHKRPLLFTRARSFASRLFLPLISPLSSREIYIYINLRKGELLIGYKYALQVVFSIPIINAKLSTFYEIRKQLKFNFIN